MLVYSLQVQGQNNDGSWSHPPVTHNECKYYTISWCGDGARDTSYNETCDPADPTHTGWGAGGCDTSCQPVNTASPACDSSHTGPQSSPLSVPGYCASGTPSGFSENGTNPINYSWSCVIGGFSPQQSVDCTASYTPPPPTSFDLSIKKYVNSIANDAQTQGTAVNIGTGTVFTYITRVTNNGPLIASGTTTVTDPGAIPAGITVTGVSGTGWVCSRL